LQRRQAPLQLHCDNRRLRCGITIMSGSANSGAPMSLGHTLLRTLSPKAME